MKKKSSQREPSAASLREIPELDTARLRRVGPRGRYAHLATGRMLRAVVLDADLWEYFGSAKDVNAALRAYLEARRVLLGPVRKVARKRRAA